MEDGERSAVRVGVLGPLVVLRDGDPVEIGGPRPRAVLVTLAHHLDEVIPVDTLIEALWGDEPPRSRRNAIQVNISLLRRALGTSVSLRTTPPGHLYAIRTFREPNELRWWELLPEAANDSGDAAMRVLGRVYRHGDERCTADLATGYRPGAGPVRGTVRRRVDGRRRLMAFLAVTGATSTRAAATTCSRCQPVRR